MTRFAPMTRLVLRQAADLRRLRGLLARQQEAAEALARTLERRERDVILLALMASDRKAALEFISDAHDIDNLEESA